MNIYIQIVSILSLFLTVVNAQAQTQLKGAASEKMTPLMGWASWNQFGVNISEDIIKEQADAMVSSGLYDAGFEYVNIDDGFFDGRYEDGALRINHTKFPNGMKELADYIHALDLKAGFYSEAGENTCGSMYSGQPGGTGGGLYNHDQQDIDSIFLGWGFDFIKVDYCGGIQQGLDEETRYTEIRQAIDNTGLTGINFNVCRWEFPGTWVTKTADSWRMSHDINYVPGSTPKWSSIIDIVNLNKYLAAYAGPGHYNDMDMLEVGRGMTDEEDKSHFSMWCILSSPLVLGNDITSMSAATKSILTNEEVIAVNQDTSGLQAHVISDENGLQVWVKNLNRRRSKEFVVALFNQNSIPGNISVNWPDLNIVGNATVRDLWEHNDLGVFETGYSQTVPGHGIMLLKVVADSVKLPETFEAEYAWLNNFNMHRNGAIVGDQARPVGDGNCSGGAKAGWLGKGEENYIEFQNVFANRDGSYTLKVYFISGEDRKMKMAVNGVETELDELNSGSWSAIASKSVTVNLKKGNNVIRFFNETDWLPDIDKIEIDVNKDISSTASDLKLLNKEHFLQLAPNPAIRKVDVSWSPGFNKLEIIDVSGKIVYTKEFDADLKKVEAPLYLKGGIYFVRVKNNQQSEVQKLMVQSKN